MVSIASSIILALTLTIWSYVNAPPGSTFGGVIYNWQASNTYLARIWQGFRGEWVFTNHFSIEPGPPVYALYINYLLLSHFARWLGLETYFMFHVARIAGGAILLVALYVFLSRVFSSVEDRRFAFLVCSIGAGLGCLALLFAHVAPDIWQTELSPFLSILSNPHYLLAIAAFIWLIDLLCVEPDSKTGGKLLTWGLLVAGALILAITQPYALIVAVGVGALWIFIGWLTRRQIE